MLTQEKEREFQELVTELLYYTKKIFDEDWSYSQSMMCGYNSSFTLGEDDTATFLNPQVENIHEDWSYRGDYLVAYRKLLAFMQENNMPLELKR